MLGKKKTIGVECADSEILILESVQPENKKVMSSLDFYKWRKASNRRNVSLREFINKLKVVPALGYFFIHYNWLDCFFIAAFMVVLLRTKSATSVMMPDLVGQQYTEVHNELMRLRFKS